MSDFSVNDPNSYSEYDWASLSWDFLDEDLDEPTADDWAEFYGDSKVDLGGGMVVPISEVLDFTVDEYDEIHIVRGAE